MQLHGVAASDGIAVGKIYCYRPFAAEITDDILPAEHRPAAAERLEQAKAAAVQELERIAEKMEADGDDKSAIFRAHLELLEDEDIWEEIMEQLDEGSNPLRAVDNVFAQYIAIMASNPDAMMQERAADLRDVCTRLLRCACGVPEKNLSSLPEPVIIAAHDLLPADTATIDRKNVLGILTEIGGLTSHSAILARSYELPAVLGVSGVLDMVRDGMTAAIDGSAGTVELNPDEGTLEVCSARRSAYLEQKQVTARYLHETCCTADGVRVEIGANIGGASPELSQLAGCVDLIGLFRTEFLYMQREKLPTEDEQYAAYSAVLRACGDKPVVLRTLDIGGDKPLACLPLPKEDNPFLGKRALRLCADRPELLRCQLRAAYRASVNGTLWIMFPMVGSMDDWKWARSLARDVRDELEREGMPAAGDVRLGVMIEIPSIALMADQIAQEADFASIGTNDLCQYTLAVDRGNPEVADYYQMYSPAVFRLIQHVSAIFRSAGKPLCVCGEMGGDRAAIPALVGMGLRKLSMSGSAVAQAKRVICTHTLAQMEKIAADVLCMSTAKEIEAYLKSQL